MTALPVTALYAALLAFLLLWLSIQVIKERRRSRVSLGAGEDAALLQATRAHGNFAEYVPICLIMLALLEGLGVSVWALHALGAGLLAGRLAHGIGLLHQPHKLLLRQIGMALTFAVLGLGGVLLLVSSVLA